jgi:hypothetical protein
MLMKLEKALRCAAAHDHVAQRVPLTWRSCPTLSTQKTRMQGFGTKAATKADGYVTCIPSHASY